MEETLSKCHVCEGTNYYLDFGFYFCSECNTQALGHCESFLDHHENTSNVFLRKSAKLGVKKPKEKEKKTGRTIEWTSWEGYNFILKGLVEQLTLLGARPELKNVVLQLWVKYLAKIEVAFTSTTEPLLPKFGLNQTQKDYMIIYGQFKDRNRNLLKILDRTRSKSKQKRVSKTVIVSNRYRKRISKSKCVASEYEKIKEELAYNQDILSQIDDRLRMMETAAIENDARRKKIAENPAKEVKKVCFNKSAEVAFAKLEKLKESKRLNGNSIAPEEGISYVDRIVGPTFLTKQRLLVLIVLGLFLVKDDVQISDVLRWIKEGHLSYERVAHLFPEGVIFTESDIPLFTVGYEIAYRTVISSVASVAELIGIEEVPTPDFLGLVRRYVLELELPMEVVDHVEKLMAKCRLQKCSWLVNQEGISMAFIIVILKTLLGLDGYTEHYNSVFARKINKLIELDEESHGQRKLFVWDDWVHYIVCRRAIVVNEHLPTRDKCDMNLPTPAYSYSHWWHYGANKDPNILANRKETKCKKAHLRRVTCMRKKCESLPHVTEEDGSLKFPPALTPLASYLQEIRAHFRSPEYKGSGVFPTKVLTNAHALTSIEYLLQPDKIAKFAKQKGLNVTILKSRASKDEGVPDIKKMHVLSKSFSKLVYFGITYDFDPPPKTNTKKKVFDYQKLTRDAVFIPNKSLCGCGHLKDCEKSGHKHNGNGADNESDSSKQLVLFTPFSDYWFYKIKHRQREVGYEAFIEPKFAESFQWLLSECSKILEMKNVELYQVLMLVESLCFKNMDISDLDIKFQYSENIDSPHMNQSETHVNTS